MLSQVPPPGAACLQEVILHGEIICPGIAIGPAYLLEPEFLVSKKAVASDGIAGEQKRYTVAVRLVQEQFRLQIREIKDSALPDTASIFAALDAMISDKEFSKTVLQRIASDGVNAEWALEVEAEKLIRLFDAMTDPYMQARAEDIRELADGILRALTRAGRAEGGNYIAPKQGQVLVSNHLFPRAAMQARHAGAAGFATESKALFAHAAILLRGFRIPSVGDVAGLSSIVYEGDILIVNADEGTVVVRPAPETLEKHSARLGELVTGQEATRVGGWATGDGTRVRLLANIEAPEQADFAYASGLEGIGLFRTEFLALGRGSIPPEDDQYAIYARVIQASSGKRVCIRVFDFGADKQSPTLFRNIGRNPAMATRGIRRHLHGDLPEFKTQVRAILRAAAGSDAEVGILLPVVTTVEDVRLARQHIDDVRRELEISGLPYGRDTKVGAMIEVPSAAIAMREMLAVSDFVSVGTNDLLQHFMAADRDNEEVLKYNNFEDPSFIWLMQFIIDRAAEVGRAHDVTVCGEAASRPNLVATMLRMGYRAFSISPVALNGVGQAIERFVLPGETS